MNFVTIFEIFHQCFSNLSQLQKNISLYIVIILQHYLLISFVFTVQALALALTLHEKGRSVLKKRNYPDALLLLLEAEKEFR